MFLSKALDKNEPFAYLIDAKNIIWMTVTLGDGSLVFIRSGFMDSVINIHSKCGDKEYLDVFGFLQKEHQKDDCKNERAECSVIVRVRAGIGKSLSRRDDGY